jgi:hypothetical protein
LSVTNYIHEHFVDYKRHPTFEYHELHPRRFRGPQYHPCIRRPRATLATGSVLVVCRIIHTINIQNRESARDFSNRSSACGGLYMYIQYTYTYSHNLRYSTFTNHTNLRYSTYSRITLTYIYIYVYIYIYIYICVCVCVCVCVCIVIYIYLVICIYSYIWLYMVIVMYIYVYM